MSKRKPEPGMWRWYGNAWIGEYPFPFKPTLVELCWFYCGAHMPITELDWVQIEACVKACVDNKYPIVWKCRGRDDVDFDHVKICGYDTRSLHNIMEYALIRDKQPLRKPPAMTGDHFL